MLMRVSSNKATPIKIISKLINSILLQNFEYNKLSGHGRTDQIDKTMPNFKVKSDRGWAHRIDRTLCALLNKISI